MWGCGEGLRWYNFIGHGDLRREARKKRELTSSMVLSVKLSPTIIFRMVCRSDVLM